MTSSSNHQFFGSPWRVSQSLRNDRCQNILYKAVFEHFKETKSIAALLLASKSFQNSSFGANFVVNFIVDENSILLIESVLSPSSCCSVQFVPSLHIRQSKNDVETINHDITKFVGKMVKTKYFHLSLRSLTLDSVSAEIVSCFFACSTSNAWPQLRDVTLLLCALDDTVLEAISKSAIQLRDVNLLRSRGITDASLQHISGLSDITSLCLCGCNLITDCGLEHLSKLSNITCLDLAHCNLITDAGLESVAKLSNITNLNLTFCNFITDAGLEHVSKITGITSLDLSGCELISDAGLAYLAELSGMSSLCLWGCNLVSDVGLQCVAQLPGLTSIDVSHCEISDEAKTKLKNALPNCYIID